MTTMTLAEAESIIDKVEHALLENSCIEIKPYSLLQIDTALKLRIASEFLVLSERADFETLFSEGLRFYGAIPMHIGNQFFDDFNPIDCRTMVFKSPELASRETIESFGNFCKSLDSSDPLFWQKIYARIGLDFTSVSQRGSSIPLQAAMSCTSTKKAAMKGDRVKIHIPATTRIILIALAIVFATGCYAATALTHLFIELRISTSGVIAPAKILKVETFERDDGDQTWTVDLINYSFRIPEGYTFTGVNEANTSQTARLIGYPNDDGVYTDAKVEYIPRTPEWNRLKGWGYDGYGPPGGYGSFAFRFALHFAVMLFALAYAYELLSRLATKKQ